MNPLYVDAFRRRKVYTAKGEELTFHSNISPVLCDTLTTTVSALNQPRVLEVGMAFGTSSVHIADGIRAAGGGRLTCIDPTQETLWQGIGVHYMARAGHSDIFDLISGPSWRVLPSLVSSGNSYDFIFIDGWHSFDYTLLDIFFGDMLLRDGGIMAFHDAAMPQVAKALRFLETHKPYELVCRVPFRRSRWRIVRRSAYSAMRCALHFPTILLRPKTFVSEPETFRDECRMYRKLEYRQVPWDFHRPF
jgi:predicted O-methyltransferase YrrM